VSKDPLVLATPNRQRELFDRMSKTADGYSAEDVIGAAANMLINAIRQSQPTRRQAEIRFDELFGRSKAVLVDHYDTLGRKRGLFPYDQVIEAALFDARKRVA
jgi:hypothetical protein